MPHPLFLTGTARGGTNLLARMLVAGGASRISIHAFQPWFKSLRNALVTQHGSPEMRGQFDPNSPFGDGHFDDVQLAVQDLLHGATLDVPFASREWPELADRLNARAADDAPELCPRLSGLAGAENYHVMMDCILGLVLDGHGPSTEYVGLIDTWIIDLLPALARAYPDARFLVVIRDPRGVVASQLKFLDNDPRQVGHVLSIIRQWRKYVALAFDFLHAPLFEGRLKLVRYEDQVCDPEVFARELCEFLGLRFRAEMVDVAAYQQAGSLRPWTGNSAFEAGLRRIDPTPAERWRHTLVPGALALAEFCCGTDMAACGYEPVHSPAALENDTAALAFLIEDGKRACAWRTDSGDPQAEYAREAARRTLNPLNGATDHGEIRRAFLSRTYFELLCGDGRLFPRRRFVS
jgi:hypothetical protein